jgi:hypothetical protein
VALQVAYWAKVNHPQYSVLWVPALSNATFEQAYTEIAKKLGIRQADDEDRNYKPKNSNCARRS